MLSGRNRNTALRGRVPAQRRPASLILCPGPGHDLLLHAALDAPPGAAACWKSWCANHAESREEPASARLLPLVWWNLGGPSGVGDEVRDLATTYRENWSRLQPQIRAAEEVITALQADGIRVLLLKGLALALLTCERPALRPMEDVDLLVAPADRPAAIAVLERLGYRSGRSPGEGVLAATHSLDFFGPGGAAVDLHWHALQECCYPGADDVLWAGATPCRVGDVEALAPDPAGLLVTALAHGVRWNPLPAVRWIADAVTLLRRRGGNLDWDRLRTDARGRGLSLLVAAALAWLADGFGAPVPPGAVDDLAADGSSWFERVELRARQRRPSPWSALVVRWGVHARRVRAGVDRPGVPGFLDYLRQAWDLGAAHAFPAVAVKRVLAKLKTRHGSGVPQ